MGIRCTFVTSFAGPRLPAWFVGKWQASVCLCSHEDGFTFPLSSRTPTKTHWGGILEDLQRVLQEANWRSVIKFVYLHECGGVTHIQISRKAIVYSEPASWKTVEDANCHQHYDYCGPQNRLEPEPAPARPEILPAAGTATMADVERLARAGELLAAIRCYLEVHPGVTLPQAQAAISELRNAT